MIETFQCCWWSVVHAEIHADCDDEIDRLNRINQRWERHAEELSAEIERLRAECEEQARLNGMGSEREAKLMAEIERLRAALQFYADADATAFSRDNGYRANAALSARQ